MNSAGIIQKFEYAARFNIEVFHSIPSTNPYLYDLGKKGAKEWTVVAADRQTAGKGRSQRRWESPPGKSLLFSMLLRPQIDTRFMNLINLLVALTLSGYLEKRAGEFDKPDLDISLKWPNDLWINKKKLCGILLEANFTLEKLNFMVIGIGLNVNQDNKDFSAEIRNHATSLFLETGREWDRECLLAGYLDYFYERYYHYFPHDFREIVDLYQQKVIFKGEWITVGAGDGKVSGFFKGMTPEGYLILDQKGQEKIITTGDVFAAMNT